jgi:beta propeller repeat protein
MARICIGFGVVVMLAGVACAQTISDFRISYSGNALMPVVSGNFVAWFEPGPDNSSYGMLQGMNMGESAPHAIASEPGLADAGVGGGLVLWEDQRYGTNSVNLFAHDLSTGQEFPVYTSASNGSPGADGNYIVWQDGPYGTSVIDAYNRTTGKVSTLSSNTFQIGPSISGRYVVWEDDSLDFITGGDIHGYDLNLGKEFTIADGPYAEIDPAVSGNIVVWTDYRKWSSGDTDIWAKDLSTGQEFPICTAPDSQYQAAIDGNYVVWVDGRSDAPGIYGYDLSTHQEFPISLGDSGKFFPKISGNLVVWDDNRDGGWDVYGAYIPEPASLSLLMIGGPMLLRRRA